MKKILIIFICLLILVGCAKNNEKKEINNIEKEFILEKKDIEKDYVYLNNYKTISYDDIIYEIKNLVINIKSEDAENVNLELRSFVNKSYKEMEFKDEKLIKGNIINYDYYVNDKYISIIQRYYPYINGLKGEEQDNVYVISLETGKVINNKEILKKYDYSEEELYEMLENKVNSEDILFTILNIKNNGYKLFIDDNDKLNIIYEEIDNDDSIKKELVLN